MTHDVYMGRKAVDLRVVAALEEHLVMGGRRTGRAARGATGNAGLFV